LPYFYRDHFVTAGGHLGLQTTWVHGPNDDDDEQKREYKAYFNNI